MDMELEAKNIENDPVTETIIAKADVAGSLALQDKLEPDVSSVNVESVKKIVGESMLGKPAVDGSGTLQISSIVDDTVKENSRVEAVEGAGNGIPNAGIDPSPLFQAPIKKEFRSTYQEVHQLLDNSEIRRNLEQLRQSYSDHMADVTNNDESSSLNDVGNDDESSLNGDVDDESPARKRTRGQNKSRPRQTGVSNKDRLCYAVKDGRECSNEKMCRFSHDVDSFMKSKPPDLEGKCPFYDKFGICKYGLTCRFYGTHGKVEPGKISENFENPDERNRLSFEDRKALRQKKYDFDKTLDILESFGYAYQTGKVRRKKQPMEKKNHKIFEDADDCDQLAEKSSQSNNCDNNCDSELISESISDKPSTEASENLIASTTNDDENSKFGIGSKTPAGAITDQDVVAPSVREVPKPVTLTGKRYLAPLTTLGNLPFRRLCVEYGAEVTCGEMAITTSLLQASASEWPLVTRHASESCFGVQLCGSYPDTFCLATQILMDKMEVDFIDINMGCPIDLICNKGAGCMMMRNEKRLGQICRSMKVLMGATPLTVKMRTGIQAGNLNAHKLVPHLKEWGVSLFTLHGRTKEQRYTRLPDWEYIEKCGQIGQAVDLPCLGCGDVLSWQDYHDRIERPGIAGLMIARGALIKPWIFTEIAERRDWDISASERLDMLRRFTNFGLEHWGSDELGVAKTRRFLLEWLSFLHRYIPVGLLERLPQKINERPPFYRGRTDLETLFGSPDCADWITISEMLLGPVQEGFRFLPKHRANSF